MTDEQLKELARTYAESACHAEDYTDKEEYADDRIIEYDSALPVLRWLAKNYCIVSKKNVKETLAKLAFGMNISEQLNLCKKRHD